MHLYKTTEGIILSHNNQHFHFRGDWDELINRSNLFEFLLQITTSIEKISDDKLNNLLNTSLLAPIGAQEVWAAGVTYLRSRDARMEEAKNAGGGDFYQKVYDAQRPELFFKALPHRVAGHNQPVYIRRDSSWNVPEPEMTLFINSKGNIQGYTVGNDMSSRSIEGENALYLPQAKIYERSAALGPCLYIPDEPVSPDTAIKMSITRNGNQVYGDQTTIGRMKRAFPELVGYLYRECDFPNGSFLMTGTCLVPGNDFTLQENDEISISIDHIGTLINTISYKPL